MVHVRELVARLDVQGIPTVRADVAHALVVPIGGHVAAVELAE